MAPFLQQVFLGVALVTALRLASCQEPLSVAADKPALTVLPGSRASITCYFGGPSQFELMEWRKDGVAIWRQSLKNRQGDFLNEMGKLYEMDKVLKEGIWELTLTVKKVAHNSLGTYSCKYITTDVGEPKINLFSYVCVVPREVAMEESGSLVCQVHGTDTQTPYPSVDWTGDEVAATPKEAVLNFNGSAALMGKSETCKISSPNMQNVSCTSAYKIKKPYTHRGITSVPRTDGYGYLSDNSKVVQLTCKIEGHDKEPRFTWIVNGKTISGQTKRQFTLNTSDSQYNNQKEFNVQCSGVGVQDYPIPASSYAFKLKSVLPTSFTSTDAAGSLGASVFVLLLSIAAALKVVNN